MHVLDGQLQDVPVGVPGELYIGGVALARGYWQRPALTAEKFLTHPRLGRLYRTGDRGRWRSDGVLEYLGRTDHQVKLRGCRIELGEVEAALRSHPGVAAALALVRTDPPGDPRLVAYVVAQGDGTAAEALRAHLRAKLPEYMVPSAFVLLEALPLSPNGKIDRKALPPPDRAGTESAGVYVAPRTPVEEAVAAVWAEVLGLPRVGAHDNFFDLGGHSLLATRVVSRLRDLFQTEMPLRSLFEKPTISALAEEVEHSCGLGEVSHAPPLQPFSRSGELPLSFAQQRLWFLDHWQPGSALYNIAAAVRLTGPLNVVALEQSLREIVRRHEVLRTTFAMVEGRPAPVFAEEPNLRLLLVDLSELAAGEREAEVELRAAEEAERPFDLAHGPLLRVTLLRLAPEEHMVLVVMHHIVSDGWSISVLNREVAALYEAYAAGQPSPLPELPVQYADYAVWQRRWLEGGSLNQQVAYWKERLAGATALDLPCDWPRPATPSYRGACLRFTLSAELAAAARALGRRTGCTPFMVFLTAFQALLHRYSGQDDICIGTPIAGRGRTEVEGLIGCFVNTLVVRGDLSGHPSFRDLLERVREACLGAYSHQYLPFERLVEELKPERDPSRHPLFQVMFALQNVPQQTLELPGLKITPRDVDSGTSKFDLTLRLTEQHSELHGELEYSTELFEGETAARLVGHLRTLLEAACADPELPLSRLPLLTPAEQTQLADWNATQVLYPQEHLLHRLVEQQVHRSPSASPIFRTLCPGAGGRRQG
jgi:hypothetical protein